MHKDSYLLGLDLGTSTVKAGLYAPDGREMAVAGEEYLAIAEGSAVAELDPEALWQTTCRVLRRALAACPGHVLAVSISSHAETLIFLRSDGSPVRPAIFTTDARAETEARELAQALGADWLLERTGQPDVLAVWPACKIAWLRRHEPEAFAATGHYLLPEDYVLYRLSGELASEVSIWLSSLMVDLHRRDWLDPVLEAIGVRRGQLPQLVASGSIVGRVSPAAAAATGLEVGTPVVAGAMDQLCAAIAAGNVRPGLVTASTGSVLALVATTDRPILDPVRRISCYTHLAPGCYCLLPWNPVGGLLLKWFKDRFGEEEQQQALSTGRSAYDLLCEAATGVPAGCDGLVMLPHLQGMLYPEINPAARGAFFGLTLAHTRAHFTRAILEAVAFMLRDGLELLAGLGVEARQVAVLGGGARSPLWLQIKAGVCGLPLTVPPVHEAAALGAAMLAAVGAGVYASVPEAAQAMTGIAERVEPDPALVAAYEQVYRKYQALYRQLKALF